MDETYLKVKGEWVYLYRAIDKQGNTFDVMLSERHDEAAATAFFMKAIGNNSWPDKVVHPLPGRALQSNVPRGDKSGSNRTALFNMNCLLVICG